MSPRILLFGKNGQVGWELQRALAPLGELIAHDRTSCDLSNAVLIDAAIRDAAPDIIVNAGAYTAVDKAEQETDLAHCINTQAVTVMAAAAKQRKALLIHYSTDYVFDGANSHAYRENDSTNPQSIYGVSKRDGEAAIVVSGCEHLIFRTSWVFATRGNNFAKTILKLARERESLRVIADQWGAPTSAELIADVTAHALREVCGKRAPGGLYHLTAAGETSWHGYANFVLSQAQKLGTELKTYSAEPIATEQYPLPAKRPQNSRLNTEKLCGTFNLYLPHWQFHVQRMLTELLEKSL